MLKGTSRAGTIGLYVDLGTEGYINRSRASGRGMTSG